MIDSTSNGSGRSRAALLAIVSEGFFSRLGFGLISFALPLYARKMGLGIAEIGFLLSLNVAISTLLKPLVGRVADRVGYKRGTCLALLARGALAALLAMSGTAWHLFAIQSVRGAAKSLRDPSIHAMIMDHGGKRKLASAFSWYQTAESVAGALGKAFAGLLLSASDSDFVWVFGIASFVSLLPIVTLGRFVPSDPPSTIRVASAGIVRPSGDRRVRGDGMARRLLPIAGLGSILSCTASMLHGLLPVLAVEYGGLREAEVGIVYLISTLVVLAAGPGFGWLSDHVSRRAVLVTRGAANTISSVVLLAWPGFAGFTIGKGLDDIGKAAFRPAWGVLMAESASAEGSRRARAIGFMSAGEDSGAVVGPILAGFLWSHWGVAVLLGTRVALALIGEVYTVLLLRSLSRVQRGIDEQSGVSKDSESAPGSY